jgi:hypothetical protein
MMTLIPAAIVLITLTNASESSTPVAAVQSPAQFASAGRADTEMSSLLRALNGARYGDDSLAEASQKVFVVPAPDSPGESLAQITEDMAVMCRIIDKAISPTSARTNPVSAYEPFVMGTFERRGQTQGLYLDGYGALFFIEVNYLLVQLANEPEPRETEPAGDAVWSQTRDELNGVPAKQPDASATAYNAQKVENLKSALVRSLRHASNIRVRSSQDRIALVITSCCQTGASVYTTTPAQPRSRVWVDTPGDTSTDVLVLLTGKSDVDAFAKNTLTPEQFTDKVQVLRSWTASAQQPVLSPPTGVVLPSSRF